MRKLLFLLSIVVSLTLTACSTILNNIPGVYTLEIQQGNMVDQDMIDQLKPNMTKRQVLYIMGSPMLVDAFHQKRWDYLYSKRVAGDAREQKRVSLYFDGEILTGIQGDFRPDSQAGKTIKETTVDVPARDLEKTLWETIQWLFNSEPERKTVENNAETNEKSTDTSAATVKKADEKTEKESGTIAAPENSAPAAK
jgi:outer membrane protein assembly factor BamE